MSTKQENRRTDVIRCEFCGEDYSVTYRRCPFCDDKAGSNSYSGSARSSSRGGKRVATNTRGGGYGGGMQPVQIIGLVLSVILIVAAVYIVFSVLSPLFRGAGGSESGSGVSISQPEVSASRSEADASGDVSAPVIPDISGDSSVVAPIVTATGITLSTKDVTLKANEVLKLTATLTPADSTDTVVWISSNEAALAVAQDGTVTNVNKGAAQANVTVTARVGDVKATCIVRCKGGSTGTAATTPTTPANPTTPVAPTTTPVAAGTKGTVMTEGLRIRSGPSTTANVQDTATSGAEVDILEQTDGWYKIKYIGNGGVTKTGYVSKDYIKVN